MRGRQIEPPGAIDFGKRLLPSTLRGPFELERVAFDGLDVEVAFDGEGEHAFAGALPNLAKGFKPPRESYPGFLGKLPPGGVACILACIDFAFWNGPGALIPAAPVGSARMRQKDLQLRTDAPVHQDTRA